MDSIGDKYEFDFFEKSFYIVGLSLVSKSYEIAFQINYGNGVEWCLSRISFDRLNKYNFLEKVDTELLNIKIKEPKIKYLNK